MDDVTQKNANHFSFETATGTADLWLRRPSVARVASVTRYIDIDNEALLHTAITAITRKEEEKWERN